MRGISRAGQDEFAVRSQNLAEQAIKNGFYSREITPVELPDGTSVDRDDGPRPGVTLDAVGALKPVFRPDGTVTAGNCCPRNDGAAAVVVMSDRKARDLGITPLARITATLLNGLVTRDETVGLEAMCVGGGLGHGDDHRAAQLALFFVHGVLRVSQRGRPLS